MVIKAINPQHQTEVNRAYRSYRAYHDLVNLDGTFDTDAKEERNQEKQMNCYSRHEEILLDLPARECDNFYIQHKKIHGYK